MRELPCRPTMEEVQTRRSRFPRIHTGRAEDFFREADAAATNRAFPPLARRTRGSTGRTAPGLPPPLGLGVVSGPAAASRRGAPAGSGAPMGHADSEHSQDTKPERKIAAPCGRDLLLFGAHLGAVT